MPAIDIRAIIFDIGRVLVRIDVSRAMDGLTSATSLSSEEIWTAIEKDPCWPDWQEGRISPRDWHLHITKCFGGGVTFEKFSELWNRVLDPKPIQNNAFLEKLSKCYRLALISNTDPIHVAWLEANFDFFRLFPNRIYSCAVGASKPSPVIYREALRACKATAAQALYIDDIPAYVEAAQRLGMHGIVFRSPEQLLADLRKLRVVGN